MTEKEQALERIAAVHAYALNTAGPAHPFTRDMAVWLQRQFGAQGTAAIQANARARAAQSKQAQKPANGGGGNPTLVRFNAKQNAVQGAAAAGEPVGAKPETRQRPKLQAAERQQQRQAEPPAQPDSQNTGNLNPAAADAETWAPLDAADLKDLKNLKARTIATRYPEGRIEATLRETYGVTDDEMPGKEIQKAAMLKAKLSE